MIKFLVWGKSQSKGLYRVVDVNEDLFEERKGEAETLAGFILKFPNFPRQKNQFSNCLFTVEVVDKNVSNK
jgi:hypothetical protein